MGTAIAVGSLAYALPPACVAVKVSGVTYEQCGSTWYRPEYRGNSLVYIVVAPPN